MSYNVINLLFEVLLADQVRNVQNYIGEVKELESDGVFVFIGFSANVSVLGDTLPKTDSWGYILTDEDKKTNILDVYAIGDITSKKYRQITTAVADGTIAAINISKEL